MFPLLQGRAVEWEDATFHEFENVRAVRTPGWKYIERIHEGPNELYDLKADPGERKNFNDDPAAHAEFERLRTRLHRFFARYSEPKWDLWKGGRSKSGLSTARLFKLGS